MSIRKICAWCKADLGVIPGHSTGKTHGICQICRSRITNDFQPHQLKSISGVFSQPGNLPPKML
jgi:hypothetical protein